MKIKEYTEKDLKLKCLDLITQTFVELGQTKDDKTLIILSQSLYQDILLDFKNSAGLNIYYEVLVSAPTIGPPPCNLSRVSRSFSSHFLASALFPLAWASIRFSR